MRIDVNAAPEWFSNIIYLDSFNKAYYASILIQHTHNNPIVITFYTILLKISSPVNSDSSLEDETKNKRNKRKMIRNRLQLWVFLSRNPNLLQYRVKDKQDDSRESQIDSERMTHIDSRDQTIDIEENKSNIVNEAIFNEENKERRNLHFMPSINMSELSYKDNNQ